MYIVALGTAAPRTRYSQRECWEAVRRTDLMERLQPRSRAILRKVLLGDNGIEHRHLALASLEEAFALDPDTLHARFAHHAPRLGADAARKALGSAGLRAEDIDAIVVSTCTGYLCPGLTSHVAESLGLAPGVLALDLVGQGCGAAVPNLRTAGSLIDSGAARRVLSICVEVCSAALYFDDDPGVLISACLFGDGAAAAVLARDPLPGRRRVRWRAAGSVLCPDDRDYLRFESRGGMLRNILARQVPALAAKHAETVLGDVLGGAGVRRERITGWILHAGGRDVLTAIGSRLDVPRIDIRRSAGVLRHYGNLSSPFVLFVLEAALAENVPGGLWWLASFGAGFSSHGALLEID